MKEVAAEQTTQISTLERQLREANFISRFMAATTASLEPKDICSIAARHIFDFFPYRGIVFSLSPDFGLDPLLFSPADKSLQLQQLTCSDRSKNFMLDNDLSGTFFLDTRSGEKSVEIEIPGELGVVQLYYHSKDSVRMSLPSLSALAAYFSCTLSNALAHSKLKEMAMKDSLTGLFNRRIFDELLGVEIRRKELEPISLLLIDLDDFKKVNDTFGHPAGDEVLSTVGRLLREGCRGSDLVARYGGEEFAIMLPATKTSIAFDIAQRLRTRLANTIFVFSGRQVRLTASIGIATASGAKADKVKLVSRADQALYRAKKAGKNMAYIHCSKTVALAERPEPRKKPAARFCRA
jgi:diguanylate cyclase (GGDEF)-like protein